MDHVWSFPAHKLYNTRVYKALHRETGEEMISLSPEWRKRLDELRALDRLDILVCQACWQPLRLKAGKHRKPHFAHKHLKGCSFGAESPAMVEARGALYERLVELFPGMVELEIPLPDSGLPRAVDVWVESGEARLAFWVVETTLKLEARERIRAGFETAGLTVVWVMCARMLHPDEKSASKIHPRIRLSPTERDFLRSTPFDEIGRESRISGEDFGASLHYLDAEAGLLTTFRSLERVHAPNVFSGRRLQHHLDQVTLDFNGLDLFHPGEAAALRSSRIERAQRAERIRRFLTPRPAPPDSKQKGPGEPDNAVPPNWLASALARRRWQAPLAPLTGEPPEKAVCVHCGRLSADWWQVWWDGDVRRCKCRECLEKGLE